MKDVKELVLPEATDDWAAEASEFDTVDDLAGHTTRLRQVQVMQAQMALRSGPWTPWSSWSPRTSPEVLVDDEVRERLPRSRPPARAAEDRLDAVPARRPRGARSLLAELQADAPGP